MSEILFRLILGDKVVGYEKHEETYGSDGRIRVFHMFHLHINCHFSCDITEGRNNYIEHDRKDRYTGRDLEDGTKVFERDEVSPYVSSPHTIVVYEDLRWVLKDDDGSIRETLRFYKDYDIKITGIEGVTP